MALAVVAIAGIRLLGDEITDLPNSPSLGTLYSAVIGGRHRLKRLFTTGADPRRPQSAG